MPPDVYDHREPWLLKDRVRKDRRVRYKDVLKAESFARGKACDAMDARAFPGAGIAPGKGFQPGGDRLCGEVE